MKENVVIEELCYERTNIHVRSTADLKINVINFNLTYMIFQNVDKVLATAIPKTKHSKHKSTSSTQSSYFVRKNTFK